MLIETIFNSHHGMYNPPFEVYEGEKQPYMECPARIDNILGAITTAGLVEVHATRIQSEALLMRVHSPEYVRFLKQFSAVTKGWAVPSIFPPQHSPTKDLGALFGQYSFETSTSVGPMTFDAAKKSADTAITGAQEILRGRKTVYALCRPPGHHAERDKMGGYCYFNNSALAAAQLADHGRVAILDLDAHHCNGTQSVFYERSDVLTVSIHGDPSTCYPYFSGYASETGSGPGQGFNINLPVDPLLMTNTEYGLILNSALASIRAFSPNYLVLSMGFDTYFNDPGAEFKLTTQAYEFIGFAVQSLDYPTLIVQEGGYDLESLRANAVSLLNGFNQNRIYTLGTLKPLLAPKQGNS